MTIPLQAAEFNGKLRKRHNFDWKKVEGEHRQMREKFREEHKKHVEELKKFHQRYTAEKDPAKKEAIKTELKKFLADDFRKKIDSSKKRIENMKKFVARLEEQQKIMEEKSDRIVEKRTEDVLNGNIVPVRKQNRRNK
jgi:hypothetical protein